MAIGWIRSYSKEIAQFGYFDSTPEERNARAEFRRDFRTSLRRSATGGADELKRLRWGDQIELPSGISEKRWTRAIAGGREGFVSTDDVVEIAYVSRREKSDPPNSYKTTLSYERKTDSGKSETVKKELLWGDCVQIMRREGKRCWARARGVFGWVPTKDLCGDAVLEVYFIDVGQGDGTLVRTPDGRHMIVDGGLERAKQQTGKNAADFVDWKFFKDYGHFEILLDSMTASHSDNDHYGGLHDLVRLGPEADRELDCLRTRIRTLHHPGLSRWENREGADHVQGLGPAAEDPDGQLYFTRLLEDRADAAAAIINGAKDELSGPWKSFFRDVLKNDSATRIQRLGVDRDKLARGKALPQIWADSSPVKIQVLSPVFVERQGIPALPDFERTKSYNTNGHSVCYRIDYGSVRVLLTGDLNKPSMDWLAKCYCDRMGAWTCDVAKACHHGSHKISYRFLEAMRPAATVISSGDAEGYAHPRPEIVGASAVTGRVEVDRDADKLLTPLIYMTEIERSVTLGAVDRLDFKGLPVGDADIDSSLLGRHVDELNDKALLSSEQLAQIEAAPKPEQNTLRKRLRKDTRDRFREIEDRRETRAFSASYSVTVANGPVSPRYAKKPFWRSRIAEGNHYGLVNVRTDGSIIMCATMNETEEDWIIHVFPGRSLC